MVLDFFQFPWQGLGNHNEILSLHEIHHQKLHNQVESTWNQHHDFPVSFPFGQGIDFMRCVNHSHRNDG